MAAARHIFYFDVFGNPEAFEEVLAADPEITVTHLEYDMPEQQIDQVLASAQGYQIRGNRTALPERYAGNRGLIALCPNLLAISTGGAGYEIVDVDACTEAGIIVVNQAGMNAEGVAEHAFGHMLALTRQMPQADKAMRRDRDWVRPDYVGRNITGKTVGVVGLGAIGTRLAAMCNAFDMRVLTCHPRMTSGEAARRGAALVDFDTLLRDSDFVTVSAPLNSETEALFDARAFALMKPSAYFVNVSRGAIHVDADLVAALQAKEIAGAGIDVWLIEPPALDHPLLAFENVLATPHNAGMSYENWLNAARGAAEQWIDIMHGRRPPRLVNPDAWPRYAQRFEEIMGVPVERDTA